MCSSHWNTCRPIYKYNVEVVMEISAEDIEDSWDELTSLVDYCSLLLINSCDEKMIKLAKENAISELEKCILLGANYAIQEANKKGHLTIN